MAALAARALWVTRVHEPSRTVFSDMGGYFHLRRQTDHLVRLVDDLWT